MTNLEKYLDYHLFLHALFFIAISVLVYFWSISPHTSYYSLQLSLVFLIIYFLVLRLSHRIKTIHPSKYHPFFEAHYRQLIDISLIGGLTLLLVASTGGVVSPWFFLVYFYLFSVGLLLEKEAVAIYTLVIFIFFSFLPLEGSLKHYFIRLFSLLLITPLAYYLSYKYEEVVKLRNNYQQLMKTETKVEDLSLMGLELKIRPLLVAAIDKLATVMPQLNARGKEIIGEIISLNKSVLKEIEEITKEIDSLGDKV